MVVFRTLRSWRKQGTANALRMGRAARRGSHRRLLLMADLFCQFVRNKQILQYFKWQAARRDAKISEILLGRFLLYALHADSDLDVEQIYFSLASNLELQKSTMSVAEKLLEKGRTEGRSQGYWMGRIQSLEEFLDLTQSPQETLGAMDLVELKALHQQLHGQYQRRFK